MELHAQRKIEFGCGTGDSGFAVLQQGTQFGDHLLLSGSSEMQALRVVTTAQEEGDRIMPLKQHRKGTRAA